MRKTRGGPAYAYDPLSIEDLLAMPDWEEVPEIHDRLIAIQAHRLGATVLTCDPELLACSKIHGLW